MTEMLMRVQKSHEVTTRGFFYFKFSTQIVHHIMLINIFPMTNRQGKYY